MVFYLRGVNKNALTNQSVFPCMCFQRCIFAGKWVSIGQVVEQIHALRYEAIGGKTGACGIAFGRVGGVV